MDAVKTKWVVVVNTHDGIAAGVGIALRRVCLSVCLSVRTLTGKRLELSAPNLVHVYCIAVARHALTQRSKSERSRSYGYENRHGPTVASDHDRHSVHPNAAVLPAVNRSRRILTRKRALWVSYGTPDLALIGERGSVQEPPRSPNLPKIVVFDFLAESVISHKVRMRLRILISTIALLLLSVIHTFYISIVR